MLAEWRVLFAFAIFVAIVAVWHPRELRIRREDLVWFAAFGIFGMGGVQWLYYEAIQRIFFRSIAVDASPWAFGVLLVSIIVDFSRSRALGRPGAVRARRP